MNHAKKRLWKTVNHAHPLPASRRSVAMVATQGKYSSTKSMNEKAVRGVKPAALISPP